MCGGIRCPFSLILEGQNYILWKIKENVHPTEWKLNVATASNLTRAFAPHIQLFRCDIVSLEIISKFIITGFTNDKYQLICLHIIQYFETSFESLSTTNLRENGLLNIIVLIEFLELLPHWNFLSHSNLRTQ